MSYGAPTDDTVVLAMLLTGREWLYADEVWGALRRLGFTLSSQKVVGALSRLWLGDLPMIVTRPDFPASTYRVTNYGRTQVGNRFPALLRVEPGEREG